MPIIDAAPAISQTYDVIIVGSGAADGQLADTLALDGIEILMLEAARSYVPDSETPMFQTPALAPLRASSTPDKPFGFHHATVGGGWDVPGEPDPGAAADSARKFWRCRRRRRLRPATVVTPHAR